MQMINVIALHECSYSSHANAWTETFEGIFYLLNQIDELERKGDSVNKMYLTRLVIISSSYLAEQIYVQASEQYINNKIKDLTDNSIIEILKKWSEGQYFGQFSLTH